MKQIGGGSVDCTLIPCHEKARTCLTTGSYFEVQGVRTTENSLAYVNDCSDQIIDFISYNSRAKFHDLNEGGIDVGREDVGKRERNVSQTWWWKVSL